MHCISLHTYSTNKYKVQQFFLVERKNLRQNSRLNGDVAKESSWLAIHVTIEFEEKILLLAFTPFDIPQERKKGRKEILFFFRVFEDSRHLFFFFFLRWSFLSSSFITLILPFYILVTIIDTRTVYRSFVLRLIMRVK